MNITPLKNGNLVALFRSRWADNIYYSQSAIMASWSVPEPTVLPNNNSSVQVTTLESGELALVFNHMSAAGALERRASLYDEIDDGDGRKEPEVTSGRAAFWGAACANDGGYFARWRQKLAVAAPSG
jgi:predicted neuraminidase